MVNQTALNELNKKHSAPLHLTETSHNFSHNTTSVIKHDSCAGISQHITKKFVTYFNLIFIFIKNKYLNRLKKHIGRPICLD
jgi:hypothetical protein